MPPSDATRLNNCQACGAPLRDFATGRCEHCGRVNDLDLRQVEGVARGATKHDAACPRCKAELVTLGIKLGDRFEIERCKKCLGVFFDVAELEQMMRLAATEGVIDPARLERLTREQKEVWAVTYLPCPVCSELMLRTRFGRSPVIIDRCKAHGAWLDGGELGRLLLWARSGGLGELEVSVWEGD